MAARHDCLKSAAGKQGALVETSHLNYTVDIIDFGHFYFINSDLPRLSTNKVPCAKPLGSI
jgi:hypothetical protein